MGLAGHAGSRHAGVLPLLRRTLPGCHIHTCAATPRHVLRHQSAPASLLHGSADDWQLLPAGRERREGVTGRHHLPLADGLQRRRRPVPADTVREHATHRSLVVT